MLEGILVSIYVPQCIKQACVKKWYTMVTSRKSFSGDQPNGLILIQPHFREYHSCRFGLCPGVGFVEQREVRGTHGIDVLTHAASSSHTEKWFYTHSLHFASVKYNGILVPSVLNTRPSVIVESRSLTSTTLCQVQF